MKGSGIFSMSDTEVPSGALSSDILEEQFGPTYVEVLLQEDAERVIRTKTADGRTLELSRVSFRRAGDEEFKTVQKAVEAGASMGKAFRERGLAFVRMTRSVHGCETGRLPAGLRRHFGDGGDRGGTFTVVEVSVLVGPRRTHYADILEVYAPAVAWPAAAPAATEKTRAAIGSFAALLTDRDG